MIFKITLEFHLGLNGSPKGHICAVATVEIINFVKNQAPII